MLIQDVEENVRKKTLGLHVIIGAHKVLVWTSHKLCTRNCV